MASSFSGVKGSETWIGFGARLGHFQGLTGWALRAWKARPFGGLEVQIWGAPAFRGGAGCVEENQGIPGVGRYSRNGEKSGAHKIGGPENRGVGQKAPGEMWPLLGAVGTKRGRTGSPQGGAPGFVGPRKRGGISRGAPKVGGAFFFS